MKVMKIGGEEVKTLTGREGSKRRIRGSKRMMWMMRIYEEEEEEKEAEELG